MPHPTSDSAYGIWSLNEVRDAVRGDNWPSVPVDEFFANVSLLINADDEADGSTNIVDISNSNHTITVSGNTQIDTTTFKYGTGSLKFDGLGDYLTVSGTSDLSFDSDFTFETWFLINSKQQYQTLIGMRPTSTNGAYFNVQFTSSGELMLFVNSTQQLTSDVISTGQWYHFAICRNSGTTTMYLDGASQGSFADSTNYLCPSDRPRIGGADFNSPPTDSTIWDGYIDDMRITKGIARYSSDFTPPSKLPTS